MTRKNLLITLAVLLVAAAVVAANLYYRRDKGLTVTVETIRTRDLEAIVSASGKIQPKRLVNISADTSGRVVDLAVNEGDRVTRGQFLLQIDPKSLRTRVDNSTAGAAGRRRIARTDAPGGGNLAGADGPGAAEPGAPARTVGAAAVHARSAREGGERSARRTSRRCRSARNR